MGLRSFHIFFIVMSTVMSAGLGLWCFLSEAGRATSGSTTLGVVCLVAGVALAIYGVRFVKKLDEEGIE